jgi:signal transduction histidine kinase
VHPVTEPRARRRGVSIFLKLMVPSVAVSIAIVLGLTLFLIRQRDASILTSMRARAAAYGDVLSDQLHTAVASHDHGAAHAVLGSLTHDPEVAGVVLFGSDGARLYASGAPSRWVDRAPRAVLDQHVLRTRQRTVVLAPVATPSGARGTLVIGLSNARLEVARRDAQTAAIAGGLIAVILASAAAYCLARYLTRRLRAIARVASAVSRGERGRGLRVLDPSADEIGVLARAFNLMLRQNARERHRLHLAIDHLRHTEQELAEANRQLEARVAARTAEMMGLEVELRQAQKLESVGRLAAGVAHEINTPIQYVSDSCTYLHTAVGDLSLLLQTYRDGVAWAAAGELDVAMLSTAMQCAEEECDADYALEQIPRAVTRSLEGLDRVATIVRSLREFAHPDRSERAWADVNRAITSTLEIARNEYKYVADLRLDLGELPEIHCHLGELNQAILNVVVNAAHAIDSVVAGSERRGEIAVSTRHHDGDVVITVADTGTGIPADIVEKIFDPFFTTKEVGKGTGQGLAIVRSVVVDKHGGKLEVDTEVGLGTTFRMRLPVDVRSRAA